MEGCSQRLSLAPRPVIRRWVHPHLAAALLLLLLALGASVFFDGAIAKNLHGSSLPGDIERLVDLTESFAHGSGVAIILISVFILVPEQRRRMPRLVACPLLAGIAATLLKLIVPRVRPISMMDNIDGVIGHWGAGWGHPGPVESLYAVESFPSGHTATAFGLAIGLSWVFPRGRWLFLTLAVLAGFQRIMLTAHWTSDVIAGAMLGLVIAGVLTQSSWAERLYRRIEREKSLPELPEHGIVPLRRSA